MTAAPHPRKTYACCSVRVRRHRSTSFTTTANRARPLLALKVGSWPSPDCLLVYRHTTRRRRWQPSTPSGITVRNFQMIHRAVLAGDGTWTIRNTSTLWLPSNTSIRTTGIRLPEKSVSFHQPAEFHPWKRRHYRLVVRDLGEKTSWLPAVFNPDERSKKKLEKIRHCIHTWTWFPQSFERSLFSINFSISSAWTTS